MDLPVLALMLSSVCIPLVICRDQGSVEVLLTFRTQRVVTPLPQLFDGARLWCRFTVSISDVF